MSNFEENGAGKNTMFTNIKTRDFTVKERHEILKCTLITKTLLPRKITRQFERVNIGIMVYLIVTSTYRA